VIDVNGERTWYAQRAAHGRFGEFAFGGAAR